METPRIPMFRNNKNPSPLMNHLNMKKEDRSVRLIVLNDVRYTRLVAKKPLIVSYGFGGTPFGKCLIGFIEKKICHLSFVSVVGSVRLDSLRKEWPKASFVEDDQLAKSLLEKIFGENRSIIVLVRGTSFQEKVWRALLNIPRGSAVYYGDVAVQIGHPQGVRAVANAVARNPVSYLVPCHRVINKNGDIYKYSGGSSIKKKLLDFEGFSK